MCQLHTEYPTSPLRVVPNFSASCNAMVQLCSTHCYCGRWRCSPFNSNVLEFQAVNIPRFSRSGSIILQTVHITDDSLLSRTSSIRQTEMLARRMSFVSRSYPRRLWEHLSDARIIVKPFTHSEAFIPNVAEVKGANFVDIFETMHFLNGQSARDKCRGHSFICPTMNWLIN